MATMDAIDDDNAACAANKWGKDGNVVGAGGAAAATGATAFAVGGMTLVGAAAVTPVSAAVGARTG